MPITMDKLKSEEKWWQNYRRMKNRSRLTLDMILKKSFKETLIEYVNNASLFSMKLISEDGINFKQRIIWIVLLGMTFGIVGYFLRNVWLDIMTYPLIVTMDSSTYPISQIDFPAVAICNINLISLKAARSLAREIAALPAFRNESIEDIEWIVRQSGRLLDYSYNETMANDRLFNNVTNAMFRNKNIIEHMMELGPKCSEMVIKCSWAKTGQNCSSIFVVRRTARGHCCAFNYVLQYNSAGEYDIIIISTSNDTLNEVKKQTLPGFSNGLTIIVDPLLDDYAYPIRSLQGVEILLFDPTHYADPSSGRILHRTTQANQVMFYELQSTKQITSKEVRKYPQSIRKCLFRDERPKQFGNMYSYSACLVECRIRNVLTLCRCIPYFWPTRINAPVCSFDDLQCLNKYKEKLLYLFPTGASSTSGLETEFQHSLYCPQCLPDCEFTRHSTKAYWVPYLLPQIKELHYLFTENINMTNRSVVIISQSTADGTLDRLDVVSYWFEILSNIGGFAGMLVGFSLMCFIEIVYYIFLRFFIVFWKNFRMHY